MEEVWKTVSIAKDYEVSNMGRIISKKYKNKRIIKQQINKCGYCQVGLCNTKNKRKFLLVHRLVLFAFNPVDGMQQLEVNHKNENKTDNKLSNLEWVTSKENCNYGTRNQKIRDKSGCKVLCVETNILYDNQKQASELTGTCESSISNCLNGIRNIAGKFHWERV